MRVDAGYASGGGDFSPTASNARGTVKLETRTQTDFGLVRTYLEMNADLGPDDDRVDRGFAGTLALDTGSRDAASPHAVRYDDSEKLPYSAGAGTPWPGASARAASRGGR